MSVSDKIKKDLLASGLTPEDIKARPIEMTERAACGVSPQAEGYVIPYYSLEGKPIPFYRIRLFDQEIKYKQLKSSPNHVYFPPNFLRVLEKTKSPYIILTEGEKKAASACKNGFPAVAFGGVDSWRNRVLVVPKDSDFGAYSYNKHLVGIKLPSSSFDTPGITLEPIAVGFDELANLIRDHKLHAVIIYDTDDAATTTGLKPDVQKAASSLGFELRRRGIKTTNIRQCILPLIEEIGKAGLDDFLTLVENPKDELNALLTETLQRRSAFPIAPNLEAELNKKLQNPKISRKDIQQIALTLLTDLDARGIRMLSKNEEQLYYFEEATSKLTKVELLGTNERATLSPFSKYLYQQYGVSTSSDVRLVKWIATQFAGEDPVEEVTPYRVIARHSTADDDIRYQISDGQYVKITAAKNPKEALQILNNGTENVLFEAGQVEPLDPYELQREFQKRLTEPLSMWWEDVLHEVRLKNHGQTATLFSLLYYISPWLYRWRGSQLPAELIIGEAGSGKSTLCELRLTILTGQPDLRNAPSDLKDWHASVSSTGSLHVTDNIQLVDKTLKQRLSDEICRLITEPNPHIEMRKYYTNAELLRLRVDSVFAFTSVTQPFQNSDLIQRAVILELDKLSATSSNPADPESISYDSTWKQQQIDKFGGRTAWVSHHLHVLHLFLKKVKTSWNPNYQAKHRLINLEQSLMLMADIFNLDASWIPGYLSTSIGDTVVEADWTLEGLSAFATQVRDLNNNNARTDFARKIGAQTTAALANKYTARDISVWASQHESYMECSNLINARKLGRYLQTHKAMVVQTTGIQELNQKINNKTMYLIKPTATSHIHNPIEDDDEAT